MAKRNEVPVVAGSCGEDPRDVDEMATILEWLGIAILVLAVFWAGVAL